MDHHNYIPKGVVRDVDGPLDLNDGSDRRWIYGNFPLDRDCYPR